MSTISTEVPEPSMVKKFPVASQSILVRILPFNEPIRIDLPTAATVLHTSVPKYLPGYKRIFKGSVETVDANKLLLLLLLVVLKPISIALRTLRTGLGDCITLAPSTVTSVVKTVVPTLAVPPETPSSSSLPYGHTLTTASGVLHTLLTNVLAVTS